MMTREALEVVQNVLLDARRHLGDATKSAEQRLFATFHDLQIEMDERQIGTCGLCGKPLRECRIGPCVWGIREKPVWIRQIEDWVPEYAARGWELCVARVPPDFDGHTLWISTVMRRGEAKANGYEIVGGDLDADRLAEHAAGMDL
jgi:hypothetical protein